MTDFIQSTDRTSMLGFANDGDKWTINPGVAVMPSAGIAVEVNKANATLVNHGMIISGNYLGVLIGKANFDVTNAADGVIIGYESGILLNSTANGGKITNAGIIKGLTEYGVEFSMASGPSELLNTGAIYGDDAGVFVDNAGNNIFNDGLIKGDAIGLLTDVASGVRARIVNQDDGKIAGDVTGLQSNAGGVFLKNLGLITNGLNFNPVESDKVVNSGKITGSSFLGGGNDRFDGHNGVQGPVLGETGDDTLIGGDRKDVFTGGAGADTQTGNGGKDIFDYNFVSESSLAFHDLIRDFAAGEDRIDLRDIDAIFSTLSNDAFAFRGKKAFTDEGQVRYELNDLAGTKNDTTTIYVNTNADLGADMQIELKGLVSLHASDFLL